MSRRRFKNWREVLEALRPYVGDKRADRLEAMARWQVENSRDLDVKMWVDDASSSPGRAVYLFHVATTSSCDEDMWERGGWYYLRCSLPESWDVSPEEWRLGNV